MAMLFFKALYQGFGKFGFIISTIVNFILFLFVFIFGIGLVSIIAKVFGKKFINMKPDKKEKTYWKDSLISKRKKEDFYKPF